MKNKFEHYKICPRCQYSIRASALGSFCINCGEKLLKNCPGCRNPIYNFLAKHCPECGYLYRSAIENHPAKAAG
jgi:predicted amidophosphoribosyltransferase